MSGPVLAAVDFSELSSAVLRRARSIAGGRRVRLLHVIDTSVVPRGYLAQEAFEPYFAEVERLVRMKAGDLAREVGGDFEVAIARGRPADEVVNAAAGADVVVVGIHSRSGAGRFVLGSVAEEIARRSPVPVLVEHDATVEHEGEREPEPEAIERVLVAHDVADPSPDALTVGREMAARLGVALEIVHVVPWPKAEVAVYGRSTNPFLRGLRATARREAPRVIDEQVVPFLGESVPITIRAGDAATEIVRFARSRDLVVAGTAGRGALGRLAFGSVATKIARKARGPVVLVRPGAAIGVAAA